MSSWFYCLERPRARFRLSNLVEFPFLPIPPFALVVRSFSEVEEEGTRGDGPEGEPKLTSFRESSTAIASNPSQRVGFSDILLLYLDITVSLSLSFSLFLSLS